MDLKTLLKKVDDFKKSGPIDLSLEEDLSIAVMNLISLEEHFFLTAEKTGKKTEYFKMMDEVRQMRKELLAKMIDRHEGETWCITKHLLAATMRLIEVGTKSHDQTYFDQAYKLYSLFWALRLKLIQLPDIPSSISSEPLTLQEITAKLVDCCKE